MILRGREQFAHEVTVGILWVEDRLDRVFLSLDLQLREGLLVNAVALRQQSGDARCG